MIGSANIFGRADIRIRLGDLPGAASAFNAKVDDLLADRFVEHQTPLGDPAQEFLKRKLTVVEELIRREPIERLIAINANGRVSVYIRGSESQVPLPLDRTGRGDQRVWELLAIAACATHNHPIDEGRPIGGTLSLEDILLAQQCGVQEIRVAAREATYSVTPAFGLRWDASWATMTERAHTSLRGALDRAMAAAPGRSQQRDLYFYLRVLDFLMIQVAKRSRLVYRRLDRPRVEWDAFIPNSRANEKEVSATLIDDREHFAWLARLLNRRQ